MFEQDYIMRLIKEIARVIMKLFFRMDTETLSIDLVESKETQEQLECLYDLVDAGNINAAENQLYDCIDNGDENFVQMSLLFYSYLNDKTDDFLEAHDFSRKEIREGVEYVANRVGLGSLVEVFLSDL